MILVFHADYTDANGNKFEANKPYPFFCENCAKALIKAGRAKEITLTEAKKWH